MTEANLLSGRIRNEDHCIKHVNLGANSGLYLAL